MKKTQLIASLSCLSLSFLVHETALARGDGPIHRDANGWLQINGSFTGDTCVIKKGAHALFYRVDGMIEVSTRSYSGNQFTRCVATYPSEVFYMDQ